MRRPAVETHVHPTRDDAVVTALSEVVGGPMGERALPHRWWTPTKVMLLMVAVVFSLGMVQKAPCDVANGDHSQSWKYSHMCYSDLEPLYVPRGLAELRWPFSGDPETRARYDVMEYPAGIAYWAWGAAWITHWLNGSPDVSERASQPVDDLWGDPSVSHELTIFTLVNAVGFAALAMLAVWLLARVDPRRPWDAAIFALSPTLALAGLVNWDLIAVASVAGALLAWSRGRPLLTGVLIGLGTATKLYPLFLLGGVLILCVRRSRWGALAWTAGGAAVAWVVANAPAYLSGAAQWRHFWSFNSQRPADYGSLWQVFDQARGGATDPSLINHVSAAAFVAWCVAVVVLGLRAERATLAQLGYLIVVGFLIVNKVYSPQYVLWLLPLAALAVPRWRHQIVWQACEVLYFCTIWWYLGGYLAPGGGTTNGFYWLGIVVRVLGELYLAGVILVDMYRRIPDDDSAALGRERDLGAPVAPARELADAGLARSPRLTQPARASRPASR